MPIYEYKCQGCDAVHEVIQKFSDPAIEICPDCGARVTKLISNTSFVLKGSGWYKDGYTSPASGASTGEITVGGGDDKPQKAQAKPSDAKTEAKPSEATASAAEKSPSEKSAA